VIESRKTGLWEIILHSRGSNVKVAVNKLSFKKRLKYEEFKVWVQMNTGKCEVVNSAI
jgi:hypothetical protein